MSGAIIKVEKSLKKYVIMWQSLLQSKIGKYIPQGRAVALACAFAQMNLELFDKLAYACEAVELKEPAKFFRGHVERLLGVAEKLAVGELEEYDMEEFLEKLSMTVERMEDLLRIMERRSEQKI